MGLNVYPVRELTIIPKSFVNLQYGWTALVIASGEGRLHEVMALLAAGADKDSSGKVSGLSDTQHGPWW